MQTYVIEFIDFRGLISTTKTYNDGFETCRLPKPIWKRLSNKKENKLELQLTYWLVLVISLIWNYISFQPIKKLKKCQQLNIGVKIIY